jgi:hypothetical protein
LDDIVSARATGEQAVTDAVKALRQDVDQEALEAAQAKMPDLAAIRYHLGMRCGQGRRTVQGRYSCALPKQLRTLEADGMRKTVRIQANKNATSKERGEKRG